MNFWQSFNLFLILLLSGGVVTLWWKLRLLSQEKNEPSAEQASDLQASLHELLAEIEKSSKKVDKDLERKQSVALEIIKIMDSERESISRMVEELKLESELLRKESKNLKEVKIQNKYLEAQRLADSGMNAEEISKKTKIPLGEVELALNLKK